MKERRSIKKSLLATVLALCLCFSMLVGTTFAWFTDSTASTGNIIKSGTLEAKLMYSSDNVAFVDVEDDDAEAIFNYDKWEPGYTDMKYIKVVNDGTLAFMWQLYIVPNGTVGNIADVIDVYVAEVGQGFDYKTATFNNVGTLAEMIAEDDGAAHGALLAPESTATCDGYERKGEVTLCIALHMREDAGNEYQNSFVGTDFSIQLIAKQYTEEEDSFNDQYDKDSEYKTIVTNAAEFKTAIALGGNVMLEADIELDSPITVPEDVVVSLDLNGKTLNAPLDPNRTDGGHCYAIDNKGTLLITSTTTVINSRSGSTQGAINARGMYNYGVMTIDGGNFNAIDSNGGACVFNYGKLTVNGGTFGGYVGVNNQAGAEAIIHDIYVGETSQYGIQNSGGKLVINNGTSLSGVSNYAGAVTTINDGEFYNSRGGCHVVFARETQLTVNGGTFYNNNSGNATLMATINSDVVINAGTFGIKDGRVPGDGNTWTSCLLDSAENSSITIKNGQFNGGFRVLNSAKTMVIEGGVFNDIYGSKYNIYGNVEVRGGSYTDSTSTNFAKTYVSDGYVVTEIDGLYYVIADSNENA